MCEWRVPIDAAPAAYTKPPLAIERLTLTDFRNYASARLDLDRRPVVLTGPNGAGKTNLLEAASLLAPGHGLRRAPYRELVRKGAESWAVAGRVCGRSGVADLGTGLMPAAADGKRAVRVDGVTAGSSAALADHLDIVWLTPVMDGLFTGPASERRRFLDRLVLCFNAEFRGEAGRFERAMRARNRLLADGVRDAAQFEGLEIVMAETGVAIAAARREAVAALAVLIAARRTSEESPFPWAAVAVEGTLEDALASDAALDVEDRYRHALASSRERDRQRGRTLEGPHRSDFVVVHGSKMTQAHLCSTGEQKALLTGLVLAHAALITAHHGGSAPVLLLDEVVAHLDAARRAALLGELADLGAQAWLTGTDRQTFDQLSGRAQFWAVEENAAKWIA